MTPINTSFGVQTVLGLETSCDETAAAVVRRTADGQVEVLSSVVASQIAAHVPFGGVVPEIAARAHVEVIDAIAARALEAAKIDIAALTGVAATAGPGLVGGVMVGLSFGKAIALARGLPLVAVNHLEGHAVSARLAARVDDPFLLLLVSGGHCQLLEVDGVGACRRVGSTIDDAAGEAFDKIAKSLGLPYPGGPALEVLAEGGDADRFVLPRMLLGRKDCDFSFSGLKTAAARIAETLSTAAERIWPPRSRPPSRRSSRSAATGRWPPMPRRGARMGCASWWPAASQPTARCGRSSRPPPPREDSASMRRPWPIARTMRP